MSISVFSVLDTIYKMKNMRMISPLENVYEGSSQEDVRCTETVKQEQNNVRLLN